MDVSGVGESTTFFLSLAEARLDGPFHPAEQDKVHFGTPAFNFDRPKHSASTR